MAALAVGAAAGYITGKNNARDAVETELREPVVRVRTGNPARESAAENSGAAGRKGSARKLTMEEISRLPGSSGRVQAMMEYYAAMSPAELEEEAGKLDELPMNERMLASFLLFARWGEADAPGAMAFSQTMGFAGNFVRPTVLQSWASVDPAGAAAYMAEAPREFGMMGMMGGRGRGGMWGSGPAGIVAGEWAKQDPAAALIWASELTAERGNAVSSVVGEVAKKDPQKAAEMLAGVAGDKGGAFRAVAERFGSADFAAAKSWIATIPETERDAALASAISGLSNGDPQAAAKEAASLAEGSQKERVIREITGDLARTDPQAAGEFLKTQGAGAQEESMRELMPAWVARNAGEALGFANSLEGDAKDAALQNYVMANTAANPQDLVKVAETISDERDRTRAIAMSASRWLREDEAAAKAYIGAAQISDRMKQNLLEGGGRGGRWRGGRGGR